MSQSRCYYCSSFDYDSLYPVRDIFGDQYTLVQCRQCSARYLSPRPTKEAITRAYDDSYYGSNEEKFSSPTEKVLDFFRKKRAKRLVKYAGSRGTVLDIGCGNGRFLSFLGTMGNFNLFGIEPDGKAAKRTARIKEITLVKGFLKPAMFKPAYFDAVTMFHVFEHLDNPAEILDEIKTILKPGGTLMVSFPNIDSWQAHRFKGNWLHLDPPRHLIYFTPDDFIALMEKRGFKLLNVKYASAEQNPFGMVQGTLNSWCKKRDLLFESMKGNQAYLTGYQKWKLFLQKWFFVSTFPAFIFTDLLVSAAKKGATVEFIFSKN